MMKAALQISASQTQKMKLSQQMRQSLAVLQMSADDLYQYLVDQSMGNPVVIMDALEDAQAKRKQSSGQIKSMFDPASVTAAASESAFDRLRREFDLESDSRELSIAGKLLIGRLDENGYVSRKALQELIASGVPKDLLKAALKLLRRLDPPGVGALDLRDCLLLQLKRKGMRDSDAYRIVSDELALLARNQMPHLAKKLGFSMERLMQAYDVIRSLHPKPLSSENAPIANVVIPDVFVSRHGDGLVITLNQLTPESIHIDESYRAQEKGAEAKAYLDRCYAEAMQLRQSLKRRNQTMLMCFETLVNAQQRFFFEGPAALKSYTRRQIAQALQMHESTVTRALKNTYFQCDHGVFHIDQMFPHSVSDEMESLLQSDVLKEIRRLVNEEDPRKPLSDAKIVTLLQMDGIVISRRTVAKYRDKLGIASSFQRKMYEDCEA